MIAVPVKLKLPEGHPLAAPIVDFLTDLEGAGRSIHTLRCYRGDLAQFAGLHTGEVGRIDAAVLRGFFTSIARQAKATRARKQAAVASFLAWCCRHDLLDADPMTKIERVAPPRRQPRLVDPGRVRRVLDVIPKRKLRDRVLFELIAATGLRASEALGIYIEDLDLRPDDEHLTVTGKGDRQRTVLLDDPAFLALLRRYLKTINFTSGALFRAEKNHIGGPLRYSSARELWSKYCAAVGESISLHQLRHGHGTELVNDGVPIETVRKRLGHRDIRSTLLYAEKSDRVADDEIRAWRRRRRTPSAATTPPTPALDGATAGARDDAEDGTADELPPRPIRARITDQPIDTLAEQARRARLVQQRRRRSGPPVRALACPTCGHEPATRPEAQRQRADLTVTWLHQDTPRGPITRRQHCARCQPHGNPAVVFECARCGDGPILTGTLATHIHQHGPYQLPAELRIWLTGHGWRLGPQPLCPHEQATNGGS